MKVLMLGFGKIAYMPYMNFYLDTLATRRDIDFELVYWDRDGKPDAEVPKRISKVYKFEAHLEEQLPFWRKLRFFFMYRHFALKVLNANQYDRIIVLHTTPGLTLMDYLCRNYGGRYVLDFRDISYEYISIYRKLVGMLAKRSAITFVSSDAFRRFLPALDKIYTIHNYLEDSLRHRMLRSKKIRKRDVIRISYWGLVRQVNVNKKLIDALGNDSRFELHYYGRMQKDGRDMMQYAKDCGYTNIYFHGQYMPTERYSFAATTDIIHNVYYLGYTMRNAMGNKYYDGIIFGIPQICTEGSYMAEVSVKRNVGLPILLDDTHLADRIWDYYNQIDWENFEVFCMKAFQVVVEQQRHAKEALLNMLCESI